VAIDSPQRLLDARLRSATLAERRALHLRLRDNGVARVWAQVDRAGPMTALETARFVLRRLYPDLEGPRLESIMRRLTDEFAAGTWAGFARPGRERGRRRMGGAQDVSAARFMPSASRRM
jgi:hypothetical protein